MAQQFKSQIVWIIDESGGTPTVVKFEKAYLNGSSVWKICGDAGADDPSGALSIVMTKGAAVADLPDHYYYTGLCAETYTYTLELDGTPETYATGIMLDGSEKQKDIAANTAHISSDGKNHADVVLNNTHRAVVTGNPHSVTKTNVGLGSVNNTSDATKNAATVTLTNKTLTDPIVNAIVNGAFKLSIPTLSADDDFAKDADMLTKTQMVEELASGTENSITVLKALYTQIVNSEKFASMMTYAGFYSEGAGAPTNTPIRKLQFYLNTTNDDVYVSIGTSSSSDWDLITTT